MKKDVAGKPKLRLVPRAAMVEMAKVREYGVEKYGHEDNWKEIASLEFTDATLRHIYSHLDGVITDPESGLAHLSHALTSLSLAVAAEAEELAAGIPFGYDDIVIEDDEEISFEYRNNPHIGSTADSLLEEEDIDMGEVRKRSIDNLVSGGYISRAEAEEMRETDRKMESYQLDDDRYEA